MIKLKFGNHKLGDDTGIFNMGTATDCPSKKLGLCEVVKKEHKCYAEKAEQQYPTTVPKYRQDQERYWRSTPAERILEETCRKIKGRRKQTRYLRYNESGDFHDQQDVDKLTYVANGVKNLGVTTYGYTARADLSFKGAGFLVKGSGHSAGNNGRCTAVSKDEPVPEGYLLCPGDCRRCNLCKIDVPHNIAFRKH